MSERGRIIHSVFDPAWLCQRLGASYAVGELRAVRLFSRSWTDVFRVRTQDSCYALRIWRAGCHPLSTIRFECDLLVHLERCGIPVTPAIRCAQGGNFITLLAPEGKRPAALFPWLDAHPIGSQPAVAQAQEAGALLARLHRVAMPLVRAAPDRAPFSVQCGEALIRLPEFLSDKSVEVEAIAEGIRKVAARMAICEEKLPRGIIHGDYHANNLLQTRDAGLMPIDFDETAEDVLIRDVGSFLWANEFLGGGSQIADAFVTGYETERPLDPSERDALPLAVADRSCWNLLGWMRGIDQLGDATGALDRVLRLAQQHFAALRG